MNWIPLKHVADLNPDVLSDATPPGFEFDYVDISSIDRHQGIVRSQRLRFDDAPSRARRVIRTGDVLVSTVRTYLRAVASVPASLDGHVCSTGFAVLRPTPDIDPQYLLYVTSNPRFVDEVVARSTGISYPAINPTELSRIRVPIPDRNLQRRIGHFLDRECERIRVLDGALTSLLEVGPKLALGCFAKRVADFPTARVGYAFDVQLGKMLDAKRHRHGESRPYLRNANVQWGDFDLGDLKEMTFLPTELDRFSLRRDDLVVCEGGDPGRCAIWNKDEPICFQKALLRVRPIADASVRYLFWILRLFHGRGDFKADGTGSAILHLPAERLRALSTPLPDAGTQASLASEADEIAGNASGLDLEVETLRKRLHEYRDALVTEAVTGQLDVSRVSETQMDESLAAVREGEEPEVLSR